MTRGRRAALVATGVVVAGALGLAALAAVASTRSDWLLGAASRALGRQIHAERLGITVLGGVGVALSGVAIADDPAAGTREPFLAARTLEMRLRVLPLLQRRVVVDRIVVEDPVVNLVRDPQGGMNVDSLSARAGSPSPPAGAAPTDAAPATAGGGGPPPFQLASLRLRDGTINYRDRGTGRTLALTDVALDAREPHFGGPIPTSVRARLAGTDVQLEDLVSEGVLELGPERPRYRGQLKAGPGMLGTLPLARVEATVEASPPVIVLEAATVELLGGTVRGKGRVASGGDGPGLTGTLEGRGLDLRELPARQGRPRPAGRLALDGQVSGPAPGSPDFQNALAGNGKFEVADGRIEGLALGRTVREMLGPFLGNDTAARLRERYPDLFDGDDLRFTRLSGSGRLGGGRVRTDDLVLAGASYEARGAGSLGLDGDLDMALRLSASPALTEDLLGKSKARPMLVDARGQLTVPLRVGGTLQKPKVSPDPEFAATVARSALKGTGLEDVAGGLLEQLFKPKRKGR